jgi:hypothetical protein
MSADREERNTLIVRRARISDSILDTNSICVNMGGHCNELSLLSSVDCMCYKRAAKCLTYIGTTIIAFYIL